MALALVVQAVVLALVAQVVQVAVLVVPAPVVLAAALVVLVLVVLAAALVAQAAVVLVQVVVAMANAVHQRRSHAGLRRPVNVDGLFSVNRATRAVMHRNASRSTIRSDLSFRAPHQRKGCLCDCA